MGVLSQVIGGSVVMGLTALVCAPALSKYCYALLFQCASFVELLHDTSDSK